MSNKLLQIFRILVLICISKFMYALDASGIHITGVSDMLSDGEDLLKFAAKWGGIATVVGAAVALGSGRLHSDIAQVVFRILLVIGLLIAAFSYFGTKINGYAF